METRNDTITRRCNICGSSAFTAMNARPMARCANCLSLERTRLMKLYLDDLKLPRPGSTILHIAPEKGLYNFFSQHTGIVSYDMFDLNPENFSFAKGIKKLDLTRDLEALPDSYYDIVLHSHVLEHIPCNYTYVLYHFHRVLKPDGVHLFSVPIMGGAFEESFADITGDEAMARFGQHDHVRRFGAKHLDVTLGKVLNMPAESDAISRFGEETLSANNIPLSSGRAFTPNTVFVFRKYDYKLQLL